jgi:hypothetical protein
MKSGIGRGGFGAVAVHYEVAYAALDRLCLGQRNVGGAELVRQLAEGFNASVLIPSGFHSRFP